MSYVMRLLSRSLFLLMINNSTYNREVELEMFLVLLYIIEIQIFQLLTPTPTPFLYGFRSTYLLPSLSFTCVPFRRFRRRKRGRVWDKDFRPYPTEILTSRTRSELVLFASPIYPQLGKHCYISYYTLILILNSNFVPTGRRVSVYGRDLCHLPYSFPGFYSSHLSPVSIPFEYRDRGSTGTEL